MNKVSGFIKIRRFLASLALIALLLSLFLPSSLVLAAPIITIDPPSGAVGTSVTISGSVFDSYQGDNIRIFFDTTEIGSSPLVVPEEGTFSVDFTIPAGTAAGQHWIEVRSDTTPSSMIARNYFTVKATELVLDISEGNVGSTVNITGSGFYINKPVVLFYTNPAQYQIGTETVSSTGEFSYQFVIPIGPAGFHNIIASNNYGNNVVVQFKVIPELVLNLDSAGAGDLVNAVGTGFASNSAVTIIFGSNTVTIAQADDLGSFEIDFYVPAIKPMSYDVRAQDNFSHAATAQFAITAAAALSESTGATGGELTVNGSGFTPGHTITVNYDDIPVALALADNNGDFTATFIIPPGGGNHIITVSDGSNTKQYTFSVEKDPPSAPVLLLPNNESITKAETYFDWYDVADASMPITYNLEIASDLNFASVVLYQTAIGESQYILTENEILSANFQNAPYFWRIKAVDGAGNEGEYSEPWVFYVSIPTTPSLLLPAADAEVELPLRFSWEPSASLSSPITYKLQLAATPDFSAPLLNKTGLSATEYLTTEADNLNLDGNAPYFWRVQAVDSASNASDWSTTGSFYFLAPSGFPGWATVILIIIGFLIAILLAFRAGRNTAYH